MSPPFLLIDGYNLLFAAGLARRRFGPGDLERGRRRLLGWLGDGLTESERARTTVVFDAARNPADRPTQLEYAAMTIVFARDADAELESLINGHSAPRNLRLISSDHRIQRAARRRRAAAVDSEVFVSQLESRSDDDRPASADRLEQDKYGDGISPGEARAWREYLGVSPGEFADPAVDDEQMRELRDRGQQALDEPLDDPPGRPDNSPR